MGIPVSCFWHGRRTKCLRPCAHFQFKTQEEQITSSKREQTENEEKKEKNGSARETQKGKRRMAFNRKGLSAGTSRNHCSAVGRRAKQLIWAAFPGEIHQVGLGTTQGGRPTEAQAEGVAVSASDGNQVVLTVKDLRGGQGLPC